MNNPVIRIAGRDYTGWKSISIERSMDGLSASFTADVSDKNPLTAQRLPFRMGDRVVISYKNQRMFTGYLDSFNNGYDKDKHDVTIGGRDLLSDIVDCHRAAEPREWNGITVQAIIEQLLAPFNISLIVDDIVAEEVGKEVDLFGANEGETILDTILKLTRPRTIRPLATYQGRLRLTRSSAFAHSDRIEKGVNVLAGTYYQFDRDRFSDYFAKGQGYATDEKEEADYIHPAGDATDAGVRRYRPLVLLSNEATDTGQTESTAKFEASLRAGGSRTYTYVVQDWLQKSNGQPWSINALTQVRDSVFDLNTRLLCYALVFNLDENGMTTRVSLCSPEKYKLQAQLDKVSGAFDNPDALSELTDFELGEEVGLPE